MEAAGYAAGVNLPSATGKGCQVLVQKLDETGLEYKRITNGPRNRIINGNFMVQQRPLPAVAPNFGPDRWYLSGMTNNILQVSNDGSMSKSNVQHAYVLTQVVKTPLAVADYSTLNQRIEGYNVADLRLGTSDAQAFTLSFRMRATSNMVVTVAFRNFNTTRSYVVPINVTTVVQDFKITVPGDTAGTWAE